jgi:hypothetical protein
MIIKFQDFSRGISIGMGQLCGFILVPEARLMRYIPALFISVP